MSEQWTIREGTDVVGSDGDKVGEVVAVHDNYIVVEKGFFFPTDYYIPMNAVANYDEERIYLNVTKDAALDQGWDTEPVGDSYATTGGYATDMGATTAAATDAGTFNVGDRYDDGTHPDHEVRGDVEHTAGDEHLRVPVREEELTATRRPVERGDVQIDKDVITEERTMDVPVTEERVRVERHAVDRDATAADEGAFEEGTIRVPVRGEEVDVQKRARVREEVEVTKEPVERTERVTDTVRREEVRLDDETVNEGRSNS